MKSVGLLRVALLASALLLLGAATPALAISQAVSEIEVTQDLTGLVLEASFGDLMFPQGSGFGSGGEILLPITDVTSGAVVHGTSRIALLAPGGGTRVAFEGITIDWDTKTAHGGFGSVVDGLPNGFDPDADVFDLSMIDPTTFRLTWTAGAVAVVNSVFGTNLPAGTEFGIISLGADPHNVPEPGSLLLLMSGAFGLALFGRRRQS